MNATSDTRDPNRSELLAVAMAAIGSICVGTVPYLVRLLQTGGFETTSLLFWRYVFGSLILVPLAVMAMSRREQRTARFPLVPAAGLWLMGVWGAVQTFAYYKAIETVSTSVTVTIFFAYPIITLLIDRFALKVPVPRSTSLAIAAIFAGVVLTSLPQLRQASISSFEGLALAATTPFLYALYISLSFGFTRQLPTFVAAALIYAGQLTSFAGATAAMGLRIPANSWEWLLVASIGTIGGALQIASFAYALPRLSASGYAVIVSLELVTVVLIGVAVLGERLDGWQWLGVTMVLVGVVTDRLMRAWSRRSSPVRR